MSIHKIGSDLIRPLHSKGTSSSAESSGSDAKEESPHRVGKSDRVEISAQGRELAARVGAAEGGLPAERAEQIRERIDSGFYNDPAVAEQVARSVFASGDLEA